MAQATKTVKGSVTTVGADSITVKVGGKDMTFAVDGKTHVVAPGGSTKTREAKAEGKAGPMLTEVVKTGQAVEVSYHEKGMHAATIKAVADAKAAPAAPAAAAAPAAPAAKAQTASGVVSALSGSSLTIKGKSGDVTFTVDNKTTVSGTGIGTAARKMSEAGAKCLHSWDTSFVYFTLNSCSLPPPDDLAQPGVALGGAALRVGRQS